MKKESRHIILSALIVGAALSTAGLLSSSNKKEKRNYHQISINELNNQTPTNWTRPLTHIEVTGDVVYRAVEGDGDIHLRLSNDNGKTFMVAECIPELPCDARLGQNITVQGIGRYDAENPGHHWWEVHPVEKLIVNK